MSLSSKTAADLEWPSLLDHLSQRCVSEHGAARARQLELADTLADAQHRIARTAEALRLLQQDEPLPITGLSHAADLTEVLQRLARAGDATAMELSGIRALLRVCSTLRRFLGARRETQPVLAQSLSTDPSLDTLLQTLDHALEDDGALSDRASLDLAQARRRAAETRQRLVSRLEELIGRYAEVLQDRYYTLREGRYVLPVRSDAHIRVPGIVLGSSASGATLFIEPRAVVSLGNQLRVAAADVEREEARVLNELSMRAARYIDSLEAAWESYLTADIVAASARLAHDTHAVAVEPDAEPGISLLAFRHPILALSGAPVVANDLAVQRASALVISGPNAGGKTVALKCLGLAVLMVRAGLALPAAKGSRIGLFTRVLTDVGDDQSLARSLSTFSAHVTNLRDILSHANASCIVLLDELAGGTDPEEGQALAASVLEALLERGAAVAVTTHYERLKSLAINNERFVNASVGFDLKSMAPTFTVTMGIPGASSALSVAARYGLPDDVIARARDLLPQQSVGREDMLRRIQDEQVSVQLARHAAEEEARQLARLRAEAEAERNLARAREQLRIEREGQELMLALRKAREQVREAEVRVRRKRATEADIQSAQRMLETISAQVSLGGSLAPVVNKRREPASERRRAKEDEIVVGARFYIARLGSQVDVLDRPTRGQVRVAAGPLKLFVSLEDLEVELQPRTETEEPTRPRGTPSQEAPTPPQVQGRLIRTDSTTCDVRGLRADDALSMVDAFIDRMYGENNSFGFVLHGHGTGALKAAVREHLRQSPHISRAAPADPEDGGDAFTVFILSL